MTRFRGFLIASALLAAVAFLGSSTASTSHQAWMKTLGAPSTAVTVDRDGNTYVTGTFDGTVDFDPGPGEDIHTGKGVYVTRINADGSYGWTRIIVGSGEYDVRSTAITTDADGYVFLTGVFWGSVDFNPGSDEDIRTKAKVAYPIGGITPSTDVFVIGLYNDGSYQWTQVLGDLPNSHLKSGSIAAQNGSVYIAGVVITTADFDPGPGTEIRSGRAGFLALLDSVGTPSGGAYTWSLGSQGDVNAVTFDFDGNAYVIGTFDGTANLHAGTGVDNHTSAGASDIFLTKFNYGTGYEWTKTMGGPELDVVSSIVVDHFGNVYVTGSFRGTADFNPDGGGDPHTATFGQDIFLTRINSDGTYGWTRSLEGTGPAPFLTNTSTSVAADYSGGIYVTGIFSGSVDFAPGTEADIRTAVGDNNVFLTQINADGSYGWTEVMQPVSGYGPFVAADRNGNAYLAAGTLLTKYAPSSVDTTPDPFSFIPVTDYPLNTEATSGDVIVSGLNAPAPINIVGGKYSIDNVTLTDAPGTVSSGQRVWISIMSAGSPGATASATLTIGGVSATFNVTTTNNLDTTPDPFNFDPWMGDPGTLVTSDAITVLGITAPAPISITGGEYSIEGAAFTSAAGTVDYGRSVMVRVAASNTPGAITSATLTIGGVSATFSVTTGTSTMPLSFPSPCGLCHALPVNGGSGMPFVNACSPSFDAAKRQIMSINTDGAVSVATIDAVVTAVCGTPPPPTPSTTTTSTTLPSVTTTTPSTSTTTTTIPTSGGGNAAAGQALYVANCQGCHGVAGLGGFGPNVQCATLAKLNNAIATGIIMPMFGNNLTAAQKDDLVAYLATLGSCTTTTTVPTVTTTTSPSVTTTTTSPSVTTTTTSPPVTTTTSPSVTTTTSPSATTTTSPSIPTTTRPAGTTTTTAAPVTTTTITLPPVTTTMLPPVTTTTKPTATTTTRPPKVMFTLFGWTNPREQHQSYVERRGITECVSCHSITRGVPSNNPTAPSCYTCHGQKWRTPSTTTLPGATTTTRPPKVMYQLFGWTNPREQHQSYVERRGITECVSCHSITRGVPSNNPAAPSCFTCHGQKWSNGTTTTTRPAGTTTTRPVKVMFQLYGWTNPREQHQSYVERRGITGCVSCHSVTRGVPSNNPAAPSCYTCHGRKWGN